MDMLQNIRVWHAVNDEQTSNLPRHEVSYEIAEKAGMLISKECSYMRLVSPYRQC